MIIYDEMVDGAPHLCDVYQQTSPRPIERDQKQTDSWIRIDYSDDTQSS